MRRRAGEPTSIPIPSPKLWTPDSPFLYNLSVVAGNDSVFSYFGVHFPARDVRLLTVVCHLGMRTFTLGTDTNGVTRPLLNGKFVFLAGWLDQGYWPDGLYTAPTDEALAFDIKVLCKECLDSRPALTVVVSACAQAIKQFGFNTVRKHQKVEPQRWYYWADRYWRTMARRRLLTYGCSVGVIVMQDMVQVRIHLMSIVAPRYANTSLRPPALALWLRRSQQLPSVA